MVLQLTVLGFLKKVDYHIIYKEQRSLFFPITYSFPHLVSFHWLSLQNMLKNKSESG